MSCQFKAGDVLQFKEEFLGDLKEIDFLGDRIPIHHVGFVVEDAGYDPHFVNIERVFLPYFATWFNAHWFAKTAPTGCFKIGDKVNVRSNVELLLHGIRNAILEKNPYTVTGFRFSRSAPARQVVLLELQLSGLNHWMYEYELESAVAPAPLPRRRIIAAP